MPKCPPRWLWQFCGGERWCLHVSLCSRPALLTTGWLILPSFSLHRPSQLTETFHTTLQAPLPGTLPAVPPWDCTHDAVLLLPLRVQPCLWVSAESLRGPESVLDSQGPHASLGPIGEMGTEIIKQRDEGGLEWGKPSEPSKQGTEESCSMSQAPHSLTSASARLICLSRSSGIIFPLEKKIEWVEQ